MEIGVITARTKIQLPHNANPQYLSHIYSCRSIPTTDVKSICSI